MKLFSEAAKEFCDWAGGPDTHELDLRDILVRLSNLNLIILETQQLGFGEDIAHVSVSDADWNRVYAKFSALPLKYYSIMFNPEVLEEAPVTGDLADDLADIYRDIKSGLLLHEAGHTVEAIWVWKQTYMIHWGRHVTSAIHAIYCRLADEYAI